MAEMGTCTLRAMAAMALRAMGLIAGPERPPWAAEPATLGLGTRVSRSTPMVAATVLMAEMAWTPALSQAGPRRPRP